MKQEKIKELMIRGKNKEGERWHQTQTDPD